MWSDVAGESMRLIAVGAMAVLAAVTAAGAARADPPPVSAGCDDAVSRGVWDLAIDLCDPEMLPADTPDATKAHVLLDRARAYEKTGDKARAAADVAAASKLDPDSADLHAARARSLQAKAQHAAALKEIDVAFGKTTNPPAAFHVLRAGILRDLSQDDQALPELDRAIALEPKNAQAYAMRASIYLSRQDNGRAQADIQSATSLTQNCELKAKQQTYVFTCPE
jgi:tetratricopeptide (TPR) repeat protein